MPVIRFGASDVGTVPAYLATPQRGRGHGVIVIQEIHGLNAGLRATVETFARQGFVAVAPALYWRNAPDDAANGAHTAEDASRLMREMDWPLAIADLESTVAFLRSRDDCDGKVATVGYCMGGRLAFMMALAGSSDADASFHGVGLEALVDGAPGLRHPVQVHIGAADQLVPPESREKIVTTLARHPRAEVHVYDGARHGFARPESRNFHPEAYELGMQRALAFLQRILGSHAGAVP